MRNTIVNKILEQAKKDKNIIFVTGDLGYSVVEKFIEELPDQFINTGIAEQNMIGVAAGLALSGKKVFVYSIVPFAVMRCFEQIRADICYQDLDVTIIGIGSGFAYGTLGVTHYGLEDVSIMRCLPNMKIFSPADPKEAELIFDEVLKLGGPSYIRLNRGGESIIYSPENMDSIYNLIKVLGDESEYIVFATGNILEEAYRAVDDLLGNGVKISLYSCPIIKPFNEKDFLRIIDNSKTIFSVEEQSIVGGFGSLLAEILSQSNLNTRLIRLGIEDKYFKFIGKQKYMRDVSNLSGEKIREIIIKNIT